MTLRVYILNWDKINSRKDVNNPTWFKFKHKFFEDPDFYSFTHEERIAWVYLLCESSKKNENGHFTVNRHHASRVAMITPSAMDSALKKLKQLRIVEVRRLDGRYADVTDPGARLDKIRLDKKRLEKYKKNTCSLFDNSSNKYSSDFESIWEIYPRKVDKHRSYLKFKTVVKGMTDLTPLVRAIGAYCREIEANQTQEKFIKHMKTFLGDWEQYLESGSAAPRQPKIQPLTEKEKKEIIEKDLEIGL